MAPTGLQVILSDLGGHFNLSACNLSNDHTSGNIALLTISYRN